MDDRIEEQHACCTPPLLCLCAIKEQSRMHWKRVIIDLMRTLYSSPGVELGISPVFSSGHSPEASAEFGPHPHNREAWRPPGAAQTRLSAPPPGLRRPAAHHAFTHLCHHTHPTLQPHPAGVSDWSCTSLVLDLKTAQIWTQASPPWGLELQLKMAFIC